MYDDIEVQPQAGAITLAFVDDDGETLEVAVSQGAAQHLALQLLLVSRRDLDLDEPEAESA